MDSEHFYLEEGFPFHGRKTRKTESLFYPKMIYLMIHRFIHCTVKNPGWRTGRLWSCPPKTNFKMLKFAINS